MKAGDKVVCIKEGPWSELEPGEPFPIKGEIYKIDFMVSDSDGDYLGFKEFSCVWWSKWFRPLDYDFVEKVIRQVSPKSQIF